MIENVLAALIILVLLGIVMYLAFEDRDGGLLSGSQDEQIAVPDPRQTPSPAPPKPVQPAQKQPVKPDTPQPGKPETQEAKKEPAPEPVQQSRKKEARKTVPEPKPRRKIVERLPKSEAPQRRSGDGDDGEDYTVIVREEPSPASSSYARRRPVREVHYRDPWRRTDYYECSDGWCDCSCDRPYWSRSGPICWDD